MRGLPAARACATTSSGKRGSSARGTTTRKCSAGAARGITAPTKNGTSKRCRVRVRRAARCWTRSASTSSWVVNAGSKKRPRARRSTSLLEADRDRAAPGGAHDRRIHVLRERDAAMTNRAIRSAVGRSSCCSSRCCAVRQLYVQIDRRAVDRREIRAIRATRCSMPSAGGFLATRRHRPGRNAGGEARLPARRRARARGRLRLGALRNERDRGRLRPCADAARYDRRSAGATRRDSRGAARRVASSARRRRRDDDRSRRCSSVSTICSRTTRAPPASCSIRAAARCSRSRASRATIPTLRRGVSEPDAPIRSSPLLDRALDGTLSAGLDLQDLHGRRRRSIAAPSRWIRISTIPAISSIGNFTLHDNESEATGYARSRPTPSRSRATSTSRRSRSKWGRRLSTRYLDRWGIGNSLDFQLPARARSRTAESRHRSGRTRADGFRSRRAARDAAADGVDRCDDRQRRRRAAPVSSCARSCATASLRAFRPKARSQTRYRADWPRT